MDELYELLLDELSRRRHQSLVAGPRRSEVPTTKKKHRPRRKRQVLTKRPIARRRSDCRYQVGDSPVFMLTAREDAVLLALIQFVGSTATLDELRVKSTCDDANKLLRSIKDRTPLGPYIFLPGGKGKGGYRTTIVAH